MGVLGVFNSEIVCVYIRYASTFRKQLRLLLPEYGAHIPLISHNLSQEIPSDHNI